MTVSDSDLVSFSVSVLARIGMVPTATRKAMMLAWCFAEGGWQHNDAAYNPLNTTLAAAGSHPVNTVGVQAYSSLSEGLDATVETLQNGLYTLILRALQAQDVANWPQTVGDSPWGTSGPAVASVLPRAVGALPALPDPGPRPAPKADLESLDVIAEIWDDGSVEWIVWAGGTKTRIPDPISGSDLAAAQTSAPFAAPALAYRKVHPQLAAAVKEA